MRIAVFCHNHPPHTGGVEVMLGTLTRLLARRHAVTVVTTAWDGARGLSEEHGVAVYRLPALHASESWGVPWPLPTGRGVGAALAAARQADVVHAHGSLYATTLLAARVSRSAGLPLVLTEHVGFVRYRRRLANAVESAAWRVVGDRVVAAAGNLTAYNSRVVEWLGLRYPGRRVHFIGNGVDSAAFRPRPEERAELRRGLGLPEGELLVLFVGRQSEKKNLDFALAAPRRCFRLVVCGARRRLPPDVIDLGILPHARMPELFGAVDLMVNPAFGEGFPLAVQEAMACGVPVALLWDPGYEGWLDRAVPASCDTLGELGEALEMLASNPEARADLSRRARLWAEGRWSWAATASSYEALYEAALAGAKA